MASSRPSGLAGAQGGVKGGAAHGVIDHIHPAQRPCSASFRPGASLSISTSAPAALATASRSAPRAEAMTRAPSRLPISTAVRPDAAGGPGHEQRLARLQPGALRSAPGARCHRRWESRRPLQRASRPAGRTAGRPAGTAVRPRPRAAAGRKDAGAGRRAFGAGPQRLDDAGQFHARDEGQGGLYLVVALNHQQIGKVEPALPSTRTSDLAFSGNWDRAVRQDRAVPEVCDLPGAHLASFRLCCFDYLACRGLTSITVSRLCNDCIFAKCNAFAGNLCKMQCKMEITHKASDSIRSSL